MIAAVRLHLEGQFQFPMFFSKFLPSICFPAVFILALSSMVGAQRSRRPSPSNSGREGMSKAAADRRSLPSVTDQSEFDSIARVYNAKTPYALPHAMFIIDRRNKNKIYYVNSRLFRFHQDFANAQYLSLKRGEDFFKDVYVNDDRRLIVGTIAWQTPVQKFTFEFWEGDLISAELVKTTAEVIKKTFFTTVAFKPNSTRQEDIAAKLDIPVVTSDEISKNQEYLALNTATGVGRIHVIDKLDDTVEIGYNEILVLKELPIDLPPVAGIIVSQPSSPISHVNLLAKGWNIPNAYIKNANELLRKYDHSWYKFETTLTDYKLTPCLRDCLDNIPTIAPTVYGKDQFRSPPSNLNVTKLASLNEIRAKDSNIYGSKAANLGEIISRRPKDFIVPDGFAIPFVYYQRFMESNGFYKLIDDLMDDTDFVHNPSVRRKKLTEFRAKIQNGKFDESLRSGILSAWHQKLGSQSVFVRSSSNAEDTGKFSGAGLYSSSSNVIDEDGIIRAVKDVWASIWNFKAYEARERNFVDHDGTYMAVLVQVGVKMDSGGVMITKDPYNGQNKGSVYISSTFGHNMSVTQPGEGKAEGERTPIPEQILYSPRSNSIQVLTRSDQATMFVPDERTGGMKEVPFSAKRRVLTDAVARGLVRAATNIKRYFGGVDQDIEWGIMNGRIYVVQSRPYIDRK